MEKADYSLLALPKGKPRFLVKAAKQKSEKRAWNKTKATVDARDKQRCFVTGVYLTAKNSLDRWTFIDRHHLEMRSRAKNRRFVSENVLTVSRGVAQLIHGGALKLLNKRGLPATSVETIDHVAWNRSMVAKGEEPCRVRKGLAVNEITRD